MIEMNTFVNGENRKEFLEVKGDLREWFKYKWEDGRARLIIISSSHVVTLDSATREFNSDFVPFMYLNTDSRTKDMIRAVFSDCDDYWYTENCKGHVYMAKPSCTQKNKPDDSLLINMGMLKKEVELLKEERSLHSEEQEEIWSEIDHIYSCLDNHDNYDVINKVASSLTSIERKNENALSEVALLEEKIDDDFEYLEDKIIGLEHSIQDLYALEDQNELMDQNYKYTDGRITSVNKKVNELQSTLNKYYGRLIELETKEEVPFFSIRGAVSFTAKTVWYGTLIFFVFMGLEAWSHKFKLANTPTPSKISSPAQK